MGIFHNLNNPTEDIEHIIRQAPELYQRCNTGKTCKDFNENDIVKCTYLKGFMRVVGIDLYGKVILSSIPGSKISIDCQATSPEFIEPAKVNKSTLELLYAKKD